MGNGETRSRHSAILRRSMGLASWPKRFSLDLRHPDRPLSQSERNARYIVADTACQALIVGGIMAFISVFVVRLGASNVEVSLLPSLPKATGSPL